MDRAIELDHLQKADVDLAKGRERVERQLELITRLTEHGHDVTAANSLLQTMRETLAVMEEHRRAILQELSRAM
jgi:hypothetical protein